MDRISIERPNEMLALFATVFSGSTKDRAVSLGDLKWSHVLRLVLELYSKNKIAQEFATHTKNPWDELAVKILAIKRKEAGRDRSKMEIKFKIPTGEIPNEILKQTKLHKGLAEAYRELQRIDDELKQSASQKTDVVSNLLQQFELRRP